MIAFRTVPVDSPEANELLTEYFSSRELSFPTNQGVYRVKLPDPAAFTGDRGIFLLADDDELGLLGCGGVRRIDDGPLGARWEIKHLYVRPAARGQRLGRRLLEELERRAVEAGAAELVLDTNDSLEAAGGLYRSSGYVTIEPYNDNPNATTWYAKPVTAPAAD
ncbi:GNAT family N-acetyltransferase [Schumannella sp. 10F1B-5-1]|uniref:GNAT family N-acetyltransferase n=1 Tax=Schumannella sp. 10F1B-5-1 TaxID=2590780 RepID=UPI0011327876|nr:GNAT family N-acetyltransferase [Schumannella sp. 10F1B-5-1]TPW70245.1 GNAT family N-acetyltransferase [Schumannella sp. 10F1B-5-1]